MRAYKLLRKLSDGNLYPLFILKRIPHQSMNGCRLSVILQRDLRLDAAGTHKNNKTLNELEVN